MTASEPRAELTVAICTYNNSQSLLRTLESLATQSDTDWFVWEVLVVANNCSDDTDAVVDSFGAGSNVRLRMVSEPRQGVGHARLRAFSSSESEFLAYIDDDCTADPRWVASAYQALTSNPRAGVAGGRVTLDWAVQPDDALSSVPQAYAGVELGDTALNLTSHHMPRVVGANLVFRRSALEQSGWAQDRLLFGRTGRRATAGEDTEMVLFVRRAGWEVWHHPSLAVAHHIDDDRLTKRYATHIFYGFGRTSPILTALADTSPANMAWRLRWAGQSFYRAARAVGVAVLRRGPSPLRARVMVGFSFGQLTAIVPLLRNRRLLAITSRPVGHLPPEFESRPAT